MPFARRGSAALTARLDVRMAPAEKAQLREIADAAGIDVAELVRRRALGLTTAIARLAAGDGGAP
jgi:hypothetical protein